MMPDTPIPQIFDLALVAAHRTRALKAAQPDADFLWQELAARLLDRLDDVKRDFLIALEVGAHHGKLREMLEGKYGTQRLLQIDDIHSADQPLSLCARGEESPAPPYSVDLIVSIASLHWVNDLPGCLTQLLHTLKPDGLLMAMIPGERTLFELRESLDAAMLQSTGGISPRVSPMLGLKDAADLMQRAGFALPVTDMDRIEISYSSPLKLMHDLRAMGQTNALVQRGNALTRAQLEHMNAHYWEHFAHPEGGVCATFDIINLTGWAPHASQPKPLNRGSGQVSIKDVL